MDTMSTKPVRWVHGMNFLTFKLEIIKMRPIFLKQLKREIRVVNDERAFFRGGKVER